MKNKGILVVLVGIIATMAGILLLYEADVKMVMLCFLLAGVCFLYTALTNTRRVQKHNK